MSLHAQQRIIMLLLIIFEVTTMKEFQKTFDSATFDSAFSLPIAMSGFMLAF